MTNGPPKAAHVNEEQAASSQPEPGRGPIRSFRDLDVYQGAIANLAPLREVLDALPEEERFGLRDQLRRAAVSVAANIAEGYGHQRSAAQFRAYLDRAQGSCNEVLALLDAAEALGCIGAEMRGRMAQNYERLARQLNVLSRVWR